MFWTCLSSNASIAQWQSVGLVNQRSWVQSSLEADCFCSVRRKVRQKDVTPTWFEHAAFWSGVRRATVAPRSQSLSGWAGISNGETTNEMTRKVQSSRTKTKRKPRKSQTISPNFSQSLNTLKKQILATSRHSSSTLKLEKIELEGGRCGQILKLQRFRTNGMGLEKRQKGEGPTEIWTRIAGFKVQSANHYTIGPYVLAEGPQQILPFLESVDAMTCCFWGFVLLQGQVLCANTFLSSAGVQPVTLFCE